MARIAAFELRAVDLPFVQPFKHAAHQRSKSGSVFLECRTENGSIGFGECLPRDYVTGETRDRCLEMLYRKILPRLLRKDFRSMGEVYSFLHDCDGGTPDGWVPVDEPQTAAWAAVDLALLDTFGREFGVPVRLGPRSSLPPSFRYSAVISEGKGPRYWSTLLKVRLYGFQQVKLKVRESRPGPFRTARRILGRHADLRVDLNMAWSVEEALQSMRELSRLGIRSFEQPIDARDLEGLSRLVRESELTVMADESMHSRASLERLIERQACNAVNVRISKCGGLVAALSRCRRSVEAGLLLQIGCQVGESSLLSAAQLILLAAAEQVTYGEGCFGLRLLREDPAQPLRQFAHGGRPPLLGQGAGLGVQMDTAVLDRWTVHRKTVSS